MAYFPEELVDEFPRHDFKVVRGGFHMEWECPICGKSITPRGMRQHLAWHVKRGEAMAHRVEVVREETIYDLGDGTFFKN